MNKTEQTQYTKIRERQKERKITIKKKNEGKKKDNEAQ